jgi:hypothetical protein
MKTKLMTMCLVVAVLAIGSAAQAAIATWDVATVHGQNQFTIGGDSTSLLYHQQGWTEYVWYQNNGSAPGTLATTAAGPHAPTVEPRSGMRTFANTDVAYGQKLSELKLTFEYHNALPGLTGTVNYPTINFFLTDGAGHRSECHPWTWLPVHCQNGRPVPGRGRSAPSAAVVC